MIRRVLLAAILAGLAAGLVMGVLQHVRLTPLILQSETFEHASGHDHGTMVAGNEQVATEGHVHNPEAWAPTDGLERTLFTTLTAVLSATGFALLLAGVSFTTGVPVTRSNGLVWGFCGFLAVSLAPAIGLPPELPGMPAADLNARQIWWAATVLLTGTSLYLLLVRRESWAIAVAVLLVLVPHVIGAPQPASHATAVPAGLAAQFVTASLGANLAMWAAIGFFLSLAMKRFAGEFEP